LKNVTKSFGVRLLYKYLFSTRYAARALHAVLKAYFNGGLTVFFIVLFIVTQPYPRAFYRNGDDAFLGVDINNVV